jgi:hypothetical protein
MDVNFHKSCFLAQNIDSSLEKKLRSTFNIQIISIDEGMKYLGFYLKPNNYRVADWKWMIQKVEKRIGNWSFHWLSMGGRLILAKSVLQSLPVYWLSLVKIPSSILHRIQQLIAKFIWRGARKSTGFHLTKWKKIAKPKEYGGWGIRNLYWFTQSLAAKSCWRGIFRKGLWNSVLKKKYLKGIDLTSWLRKNECKFPVASIIWKNFMNSLPLIKRWLAWSIGCGKQVILGLDPFIGGNTSFSLSGPLIHHLNNVHIFSLAQAAIPNGVGTNQCWLEANHLGLSGEMATEWNNFLIMLRSSGISLNNSRDKLVWSWNRAKGSVTANLAYQSLSYINLLDDNRWWYKAIWKVNIPGKIICFMWLCLMDCILTGANYRRRGGIGPSTCSLCLRDEETTSHLFVHCEVSQSIWKDILIYLKILEAWSCSSLEDNILQWFTTYPKLQHVPFLVLWGIWKYRIKYYLRIGPGRIPELSLKSFFHLKNSQGLVKMTKWNTFSIQSILMILL